jgi:ABC-2 type transport system ATP-binding protein
MTNDTAIELNEVGKRYRQYHEESMLLKRLLQPHRRRRAEELWALRDVSLTLERGSTIGIVGRNGSGKTTLLRLLSGVSAPTTGRLRVVGRIAPLIGVGVGFNAELTGRENVQVNGRLLGMSRAELTARFDDIVEFSELSRFIDTPVKFYSTGMFLRLAFAVAIHTEPDIFLLDEILAVGDAAFQMKCAERMRAVREDGTTIVLVTHSLDLLNRMTPRTVVLDRGNVEFDGPTEDAIGVYQEVMQRDYDRVDHDDARLTGESQHFAGGVDVAVDLCDAAGLTSRQIETGEPLTIRVRASFEREVAAPNLGLMVGLPGRGGLYAVHTAPGEYDGEHGPDRPLEAEIALDNRLLSGTYTVTVGVFDTTGSMVLGRSRAETFYVTSLGRGTGVVDLRPRITMGGRDVDLAEHERLGGVF